MCAACGSALACCKILEEMIIKDQCTFLALLLHHTSALPLPRALVQPHTMTESFVDKELLAFCSFLIYFWHTKPQNISPLGNVIDSHL